MPTFGVAHHPDGAGSETVRHRPQTASVRNLFEAEALDLLPLWGGEVPAGQRGVGGPILHVAS